MKTIIIIASALLMIALFFRRTRKRVKIINIPDIHSTKSLNDMVMSLNHGRAYPYYTGMNIDKVKSIVGRLSVDTSKFDVSMQMYEMMGFGYLNLPDTTNPHIDRLSVSLNRNEMISSIGIDIKDFDVCKVELTNMMLAKFGRPISMDKEFIIWRDGFMVVNISYESGSIGIIDERLFGC